MWRVNLEIESKKSSAKDKLNRFFLPTFLHSHSSSLSAGFVIGLYVKHQ